ncbi:50S ribosomal protein L35 [Aedoeadaptatus ivorii]|uniref:Large ribosomal subunit protein bL35 n=1 Tax=Aedoeadaptatus ivorii TaxID=54006 RepID=A0A448V1P1_9FIRM|nr:50S ribosomal protein L35 [Peptoniphilus ivorii]MDQ0508917.1 large subunit ribosomal protein L35 [Peptoniphilus ivorii]VEJ35743.1 50S ribosomal protein L35 [Peptoniphilus ivorii]
MGKMKTHRGSAKRFRRTGTGKLRRYKAYKGHLTGKKSPRRTRNLRKGDLVSTADTRRIDKMIP